MAASLGGAAPIAVFLIPFAIGVATGVEFTFASLAFPPIAGLIHGPTLAVAFAGGFLGVMLSPAHSCLVLTVEHYKADLAKVYKLLALAGVALAALTAAYSLLLIVSSAVPA